MIRNGKAQESPVKIGIRSDKYIQITSGLSIGDTIVRTGILQVKDGSSVAIQK